MSVQQYTETSFYDLSLMVEGYKERQEKEDKKQWYHTRQICWLIYQANADPKNPKTAKTIDSYWSLEPRSKPKRIRNMAQKVQQLEERLKKINNG